MRRSVKYYRKRKDAEIVSGMELTAGIPKTKSSIRDVPLNFVALEMIKELRAERYFGYDSPLLCKSDGSFTNPNELGGRFYRFGMVVAVSANGSPYLPSFKSISSFSADKTTFFSMRLFCG